MLFGVTVALAYGISNPLYPKGIEPKGHSHAFDVYSNPFQINQASVTEIAKQKATDFWKTNEYGGTYLLASLILIGVVFRIVSNFVDLETWYQSSDTVTAKFDKTLPGWVLGVSMVLLLLSISVASCYVYYPPPEDILADMDIINTDCFLDSKNQKWEAAEKSIQMCDDLSRRLEVGIFLRLGTVDEFHSTIAQLYREKLDELRHSVEDKDVSRVHQQANDVQNAYRRLKSAFKKKFVT